MCDIGVFPLQASKMFRMRQHPEWILYQSPSDRPDSDLADPLASSF